jgi:Zn-dependent protease
MKGSFHIATFSGIPVKIHWSFGLLLLYIAFDTSRTTGFKWLAILISIGFVLSVFFCVILHEFGHALMARRFGVQTHDITMTPIGGIARLERMPEGKGQEFWVAIAGPMVNFVIVGLIWCGFLLFEGIRLPLFSPSLWAVENQPPSYFIIMLLANGYLGVFNLIPAFPMDGGRMLRSLLSLKMSREKATQIASITGQVLASGLFLIGLYRAQPTLALIGLFIFFAARQENKMLQRQSKLEHSDATDLMSQLQQDLFLGQPLQDAQEKIQKVKNAAFIVWSRPGIPAGYVTKESLLSIPLISIAGSLVDPWVIPVPVVVGPNASARQVIGLMQQQKLPVVLVGDHSGYLGEIHWENV